MSIESRISSSRQTKRATVLSIPDDVTQKGTHLRNTNTTQCKLSFTNPQNTLEAHIEALRATTSGGEGLGSPAAVRRPAGFSFLAKFRRNFQNFAFFAEVQKKLYQSNFSVKIMLCFKITPNHTKMIHYIS